MTRKDYIALAKAINAVINYQPRTTADLALTADLVYAIGWVLQKDNPNFDKQRFTDACMGVSV